MSVVSPRERKRALARKAFENGRTVRGQEWVDLIQRRWHRRYEPSFRVAIRYAVGQAKQERIA